LASQHTRTRRHTALNDALYEAVRKVSPSAEKERPVGHDPNTNQEGRMDIVATIAEEGEVYIDTTVVTINPHSTTRPTIPSDHDVTTRIAYDEAHPQREPIFFWEDHSNEEAHPDVVRIRTARRMMIEATILANLRKRVIDKRTKYAGLNVPPDMLRPFVLSAGGSCDSGVSVLLDSITQMSSDQLGDQSVFRKRVAGQMAIHLLKFGNRMFRDAAFHARTGFGSGATNQAVYLQ
jgi:hypothetical protein